MKPPRRLAPLAPTLPLPPLRRATAWSVALIGLVLTSCGGPAQTHVFLASSGNRIDTVAEFDPATMQLSRSRPVTVPEGFWPEGIGNGLWAWAASEANEAGRGTSVVRTARLASDGEVTLLHQALAAGAAVRDSVVVAGHVAVLSGGIGRETAYTLEVFRIEPTGAVAPTYRETIRTGDFGGGAWLAIHPLRPGFLVSTHTTVASYELAGGVTSKAGEMAIGCAGTMAVEVDRPVVFTLCGGVIRSVAFDTANPTGRLGPELTLKAPEFIVGECLATWSASGASRLLHAVSPGTAPRLAVVAPTQTYERVQDISLPGDGPVLCSMPPGQRHLVVTRFAPGTNGSWLSALYRLNDGRLDPDPQLVPGRLGPFVEIEKNR